jgi:hypothetical protein
MKFLRLSGNFFNFLFARKTAFFLLLDFGPTEMTAGTHTYVRQEALHQRVLW